MDRGGKVALQGSAHDVFTRLTFDEAFAGLPVCLPEPLLIMRDWLNAQPDTDKSEFRAKQLQSRRGGAYSVPYLALAELIRRYPRTTVHLPAASPDTCTPFAEAPLLIEARGIDFQYREKRGAIGTPVLCDAGFSISEGEFVAIAGPNGAGKTTLLNILFRVLQPDKGRIHLSGIPLDAIKTQALYKRMGLLFQNPEWQFVTNCVADELAFSLKKSELSEDEKRSAADRILQQFHLEKHRDKSPFLLSQGEKRRLSVACMLLTGQKTLFFDEPTYGQDLETSRELMQLLQTLRGDGVTIVIVTHDMGLVCRYADRLLLLCEGGVAFNGKPEELFSRPLVPQWRMEYPPTRHFCDALSEYLPDFPIYFRADECISYLNTLSELRCCADGGESA